MKYTLKLNQFCVPHAKLMLQAMFIKVQTVHTTNVETKKARSFISDKLKLVS